VLQLHRQTCCDRHAVTMNVLAPSSAQQLEST
jgi:hypothetical protein